LTTRKNQNSILVLATLGVYLGLVLVGATIPAIGQTDAASADQFGIYINKRPVKDFSFKATGQIESKKVDLDAAFKVMITGTLGLAKDGKTCILIKPMLVPGGNTGDPAMQKLAQDAILAIVDAGWFGYLRSFDRQAGKAPKNEVARTITIQVEQNDRDFLVNITAQQADINTAKTVATGMTGLLRIAGVQTGGDESTILKFTTATSEGKDLLLNFASPKKVISEMIQRKLAEQRKDSNISGQS